MQAASNQASPAVHGAVLFTAFEPSGDAHAAPVIAELRRCVPDVPVIAWGGPRMKEAGATVIERSADEIGRAHV